MKVTLSLLGNPQTPGGAGHALLFADHAVVLKHFKVSLKGCKVTVLHRVSSAWHTLIPGDMEAYAEWDRAL